MKFRLGQRWVWTCMLGGLLIPNVLWPDTGLAQAEFRWAVLEQLSPNVQLKPAGAEIRPARVNDIVQGDDFVQTAATDSAELHLNNGVMVRLGGNTVFSFDGESQTLHLTRGTLLLVAPTDPAQAETAPTIETPNTATEATGSALFVRYVPETQTTVVGALTDGPRVIASADEPEQSLRSGQIVAITEQSLGAVYDFDLLTFYDTSRLASQLLGADLEWDGRLQTTRQNMWAALVAQSPVDGEKVIENPGFIGASDGTAGRAGLAAGAVPIVPDAPLGGRPEIEGEAGAIATPPDALSQTEQPSSQPLLAIPGDATAPAAESESLDAPLSSAPTVLNAVDFDSSVSAEINPGNETGGISNEPAPTPGGPVVEPPSNADPSGTTGIGEASAAGPTPEPVP